MKRAFAYILIIFGISCSLLSAGTIPDAGITKPDSRVERFDFTSGGIRLTGKIYIPAVHVDNKNLPAVYLIDYTEQHFRIATDEFEKVIAGVEKLPDVDALVVALDGIPDIDAEPDDFSEHYNVYKDMAAFVDGKYTTNTSRTFIGKGSESGVVLMALFLEDGEAPVFENFIATDPSPLYASAVIELIENGALPKPDSGKKLHLSFSTSNDRNKCLKLIGVINEARFPWLEFRSVEYTSSDYENTYPISYAAGVEFVFNSENP